MRMIGWRYGSGCLFLLVFAAVWRILLTPPHHVTEPKVSNALITHIVDQTEPLFREILPTWDVLHIRVCPTSIFQANGSRRNLWQAECLDDKGKEIAHLIWDDANKQPVLISRIETAPAPTETACAGNPSAIADATPVCKPKAIATAGVWLTRLKLASPDEIQRTQCQVIPGRDVWCFRMPLSVGVANVWMNARSGEFLQVKIRLASALSSQQTKSEEQLADAKLAPNGHK